MSQKMGQKIKGNRSEMEPDTEPQIWSDAAMSASFERFKEIFSAISENQEQIVSEEDSKIQAINRILTECLGWQHGHIQAEKKNINGFSDYLISEDGENCITLEAKRVGILELDTSQKSTLLHLKLNGPVLRKIQDAIDQTASYAHPNGTQLCILTDGFVWIFFKAIIAGQNFKEKEAFAFTDLDAINTNFSDFYSLGARASYREVVYPPMFDKLHHSRALLVGSTNSAFPSQEIFKQRKSPLAFDLDVVFDKFFNRLTGEVDDDMIEHCFVETRESRIADHALDKLTVKVLGNVRNDSKNIDAELSAYIDNVVELDSGESIFIIGPTGSGKSTFLSRFFKSVLNPTTRDQCITVRLNFLRATGTIEECQLWMTEMLIEKLELAIYSEGRPSWDQLRGLYYGEYLKKRQGIWEKLSSEERKNRFTEYMEDKIENDREGYVKRLLADIARNREKLPIIIADNTDEFDEAYKKAIFQYVQSLRMETRHCIVIIPLNDKSAWAFSKSELYSIYNSKSFFLPTPSPREVVKRRIQYLNSKLSEELDESVGKRYLTSKGINISIRNLKTFTEVLEDIFVSQPYTATILGELTNFNVRRMLQLTRRVVASPVLQIEDLVASFVSGQRAISNAKFMNALLKGDYSLYNKEDTEFPELHPIFDASHEFRHSPLLDLRILSLLDTIGNVAKNVEERHLPYKSIVEYFTSIGAHDVTITGALKRLIKAKLLEPFDPTTTDFDIGQKLAITFNGRRHLKLATTNAVFFEQMALTSTLTAEDTTLEIKDIFKSDEDFQSKTRQIRSKFANYLLSTDQQELNECPLTEQYECQRILLKDISKFSDSTDQNYDVNSNNKRDEIQTTVKGTIDFYNATDRFGFVDATEANDRFYISHDVLTDSGFSEVWPGDDIICDIGPSEKGPRVIKVHSIVPATGSEQFLVCSVVKLIRDRHFGFASVEGINDEAFFHFSVFNDEEITLLDIEYKFEANIISERKTGFLQIRKVHRSLERP